MKRGYCRSTRSRVRFLRGQRFRVEIRSIAQHQNRYSGNPVKCTRFHFNWTKVTIIVGDAVVSLALVELIWRGVRGLRVALCRRAGMWSDWGSGLEWQPPALSLPPYHRHRHRHRHRIQTISLHLLTIKVQKKLLNRKKIRSSIKNMGDGKTIEKIDIYVYLGQLIDITGSSILKVWWNTF